MSGWGWAVLTVLAVGCAVAEYREWRAVRAGKAEVAAAKAAAADRVADARQQRDVAHQLADVALRRVRTLKTEVDEAQSATRAAQARLVACASCERRPRSYDAGGHFPPGVTTTAPPDAVSAFLAAGPPTAADILRQVTGNDVVEAAEPAPEPSRPGPAAMPSGVAAVHRRARRGRGRS